MRSLLRRGFFVCPQMYKILKFSKFWLKKAIIGLVILILALNMPTKEANAAWNYEDIAAFVNDGVVNKQDLLMIVGGSALMGVNQTVAPKTIQVIITGYSSTPDQTDSTPFITASNTKVRDGIVAANFLAFGTKVKIPGIFGDKVFTVEDRMAKKHDGKIDIWFPERVLAKRFGVQEADVIILE